jgi:hypothetical protein
MMDSLDNSSLNRKDVGGFVWDRILAFGKLPSTEGGFVDVVDGNTH